VVVEFVRRDELCRRFMHIPGVGPISALAFKTAIDDPRRFRQAKTVRAYLGLTSRRWQSGTSIDIEGRISKAGDGDVRHTLYEAANIMLTRFRGFTSLKAWGLKIAKTRGHKRACVAVARKLAMIMYAMWRDGSEFRFKQPKADRSASGMPKLIGTTA
jgi:transposase